ncbi:hypothetical protein ABT095_14495 [Kitasatospora sp. NPDC002227]|uniref:hypothetical protein n=1 Tax=Kitasatospora sp. NPDC002227 TaxID=3154773 RepID=UPI00331C0E92
MGHERSVAPPGLRRVLQDLVHAEEENAVPTLAAWLDVPVPAGLWGRDLPEWVNEQLQRLPDPKVFDLLEQALRSNGRGLWSSYDERVNKILKEAGIGLVMIDGSFIEDDEGAEELDVQDATTGPLTLLAGKYATAREHWAKALVAQKAGDDRLAVALAVNTLEGVVKIASGQKDINAGLRRLFPEGERTPLCQAINQLHNFGSAMPWVRHGGGQKDVKLTRIEALGVVRAAAVWIVMLINLDKEGRF